MIGLCSKKIIKSPLRYPGGKGVFFPFLAAVLEKNKILGGTYLEPFAGGSGVALGLLSSGAVSRIYLNDADYHIYCFWAAILQDNERFLEKIYSVDLSIEEWQKQKGIYVKPNACSIFEIGFSTFYLNRCNRSGILNGAGPIGGYEQNGKWKLDARFNKKQLINRISAIGAYKQFISIYNLDAIEFLQNYLKENKNENNDILVYIDPPYVSAGSRLYLNLYHESDHKKLAEFLKDQHEFFWILTYDDNSIIRELYSSCQRWSFSLGYSLQKKHKGTELLIAPKWLEIPINNEEIVSKRWSIIEKIV